MRERLVVWLERTLVENMDALAKLKGESRSSIARKLILAGCLALRLPEPTEDNFISHIEKEI